MRTPLFLSVATAALLITSAANAQDTLDQHKSRTQAPAARMNDPTSPAHRSNSGEAKHDKGLGASEKMNGKSDRLDRGSAKNGQNDRAAESKDRSTGKSTTKNNGKSNRSTNANKANRDETRSNTGLSESNGHRTNGSKVEKQRDGTNKGTAADKADRNGKDMTGEAATEKYGGSKSLSLSQEEKTKVQARFSSVLEKERVTPQRNVNFSISVGTRVPRSVHLYTVPSTIVSIEPRFRGYRYFVAEDEIVIVEPGTMAIVEVLPRGGGHASVGNLGSSRGCD
jgi:hypothetical protein